MASLKEGPSIVLTLVMVGLLIGVGLFVLQELRDVNDLTVTATRGNTTQYTVVQDTGLYLGIDSIINSTFEVYNHTGSATLNSSDYHLNSNTGVLTVNELGYNKTEGGLVNTSFDFSSRTYTYDAINRSIIGVNEFPSWLTIIVVVLAASIIIGIIIRNFGGRGPS